ncbi:MAG: threonine synthase [Clostridia bacterium]|nr:threonine synthase [Clostridia bacterium]
MSFLTHLECPKCGAAYDPSQVVNLCACGSPLLARYDLERLARAVTKEDLVGRRADLWRYWEFLPLERKENIVSLGEGFTPILRAPNLGRELRLKHLYIKDEGLNPTGTFKARGAAVGVSKAKELGIKKIALPTAGNAGGAWSAFGVKAGMEMIIAMPQDAPDLAKKECIVTGATTYLVEGLISDAGQIIARGVKEYGWFEASTLKEPYRIEGKKTMGLEIAEQFNWELPDAVLYPTGGGVGIIGIWKALNELKEIGWIEGPMPKLISVQAEGCAPIVKAFAEGKKESEFWHGARTIAGGIRVPKALGDFLVLEAVYSTKGTAVSVSDAEIMEALKLVARTEGMFICPEGAATVAAAKKLRDSGFLGEDERVVLLNTGSGLKYPELVEIRLPIIKGLQGA